MADRIKTEHQKAMGNRLRQLRMALGMTQAEFGEAASVGLTTVAGWESGRNMIDLVHLSWAADALHFSVDFVARGDLGGLRHDMAVKIQAVQRNDASNPPTQRGRRPAVTFAAEPQAPAPMVRDVPERGLRIARRQLHEEPSPLLTPPKTRHV